MQLPAAILEIVLDTPNSALGLSYRRYIKAAFLPGTRRVAEILRAHSATIEVGNSTQTPLWTPAQHQCSICRVRFGTVPVAVV